MVQAIDVVIPTLKPAYEIRDQIAEMIETAGMAIRVYATCQMGSASQNRNRCLDVVGTSIFVMTDDDLTGFPVGWAVDMVKVMLEYPDCVMASPRLMNPDGSFGGMVGHPEKRTDGGIEILRLRELVTACCVLRRNDIRFDEGYIGSGFEDNDYCRQLRQAYPEGIFICNHSVRVVHLNEQKNQGGKFWDQNKEYYERKWDV